MHLLTICFLLSSLSYALDYDPKFHLRHRYNGTEKSLQQKDITPAHSFQRPERGLKNHPYLEEESERQSQQERPEKESH